jgi:hypothetical protein
MHYHPEHVGAPCSLHLALYPISCQVSRSLLKIFENGPVELDSIEDIFILAIILPFSLWLYRLSSNLALEWTQNLSTIL